VKVLYVLAASLVSMAANAQQPPASTTSAANAPAAVTAETRISISAVDIADRIRQAEAAAKSGTQNQNGPLLQTGPFRAELEYHATPSPNFAVHVYDAELFVVLDGYATLTVGGTLINPTSKGANLVVAPTVDGGIPHKLVKGDMVLVPANTPHAITQVDGKLVLMTMHLPRPVPTPAAEPVTPPVR
jgi:mannose-6-phosphate isomerase-like protein (cupin superfamily)